MSNKMVIADKTYTYLKNGIKILLVLLPSIPTGTKLIEPALELFFKNLLWSGILSDNLSTQHTESLRKAIKNTFNSVSESIPLNKRELMSRAWPELEDLLQGLTTNKIDLININESISKALSRPSNLEAEVLTERDFNDLTKLFLETLEKNMDNTPLADMLNRKKISIICTHIETINNNINNLNCRVTKLEGVDLASVEENIIKNNNQNTIEIISAIDTIGTKIPVLSEVNNFMDQKFEFVKKWNDVLFLHKDIKEHAKKLKLCDLYMKPRFTHTHAQLDIDEYIEKFLMNVKSKSLIILGYPGLGKSSLMCYLANKYVENNKYIFIKMHELETAIAEVSLLDSIVDFLGCKKRDLKNTTLFLDGYDELRVNNKHSQLCADFLTDIKTILGMKVIISSRLNYIDLDKKDFGISFSDSETIQLEAFKKEETIEFVKKYNSLMSISNKNRINELKNISTEQDIFGIPFILYLVCSFNISFEGINNIFDVYDKVFAFNGGLFDKIYDENGHYLTMNPEYKKQLLQLSALFAFNIFNNKSNSLATKEYQKIILDNYPSRVNDFAIGNYYNIESEGLMFVHRTFYEYFLCRYIITQLENSVIDLVDDNNLLCIFTDTFKNAYIFTRLEKLLEISISKSDILNKNESRMYFESKSSYIINNFIYTEYKGDGVKSTYIQAQNILSSIWKLLILLIGDGWQKHLEDNTVTAVILRNKGYAHLRLKNISLTNSDLSGSFLRTNLSNSILHRNNLCRTDMRGVEATGTDFSCSLMKMVLAHKANFSDSIFNNVELNNSDLRGSIFKNCKFHNSRLYNCCLEYSVFTEADLENTYFNGASLRGSDFRCTNLVTVDFVDSDLRECDFRNTVLWVGDLSKSNKLPNQKSRFRVNLTGARLENAVFNEEHLMLLTKLRKFPIESIKIYVPVLQKSLLYTNYLQYCKNKSL